MERKMKIWLFALALAFVGQACAMDYYDPKSDRAMVRQHIKQMQIRDYRQKYNSLRNNASRQRIEQAQARLQAYDQGIAPQNIPQMQPNVAQQPVQGQQAVMEECPICMEQETANRTPCCKQAICPKCWVKSLANTGGNCPFCREPAN